MAATPTCQRADTASAPGSTVSTTISSATDAYMNRTIRTFDFWFVVGAFWTLWVFLVVILVVVV